MKTEEGAYIIPSFKNKKLKKSQKKKSTIVQPSHQAQVVMVIFYRRALYNFKTTE